MKGNPLWQLDSYRVYMLLFLDGGSDGDSLNYVVSLRKAFVPSPGRLILAADFSQLELRILAHLSGDQRLVKVLRDGQDVFKLVAASWLGLPNSEAVTEEQRRQAKQICYGIIYGMGAKGIWFANRYTAML